MSEPTLLCRIALEENPILASNIHKIIKRATHTEHMLKHVKTYVPLKWSLEDARIALAFENSFKVVLVQYRDKQITEKNAKELTSSFGKALIPETQMPRYVL